MDNHPKKQRTLVIIKPDGVQRSLMGEIVKRFERTGLKFTGFKFVIPTEDQCWEHYQKDDAWFEEKGQNVVAGREKHNLPVEKEAIEYGRDIIRTIVNYMTSGPVLAMVVEGNRSVDIVKKLVGGTEPTTSDVGTIRGDFTVDSFEISTVDDRSIRNLIHCSDSPEEASREIDIWFNQNELLSYRLVQEQILYDVNLDGIKE